METSSIVDHQRSPTISSQKRKRARASDSNGSTQPKRSRKGRKSRFSIDPSEIEDGDEVYNCHLSAHTRDAVLKLKKIVDPFDDELQEVVDSVFGHLEQQSGIDVNLAESALLLSSVTHVYGTQVKTLHEDVLAFAARLTGKEPPQRGKHRKKGCDKEGADQETQKDADAKAENKSSENEPKADDTKAGETIPVDAPLEGGVSTDCDNGDEPVSQENSAENGGDVVGEPETNNGVTPDNVNGQPPQTGEPEEGKDPSKEGDSVEVPSTDQDPPPPSAEESQLLEKQILDEIPSRCTRRQSERLKNILNLEKQNERDFSKLKKRKFDDDPPELISCYDEWDAIQEAILTDGDIDIDDTLPPVLEVQVGRKRKKITINNNEINEDNGCITCQIGSGSTTEDFDDGHDHTKPEPEPESAALDLPTFSVPSTFCGQQYETLDHLPNDIQESFHALVQEMHKLPFDYGLLQHDMFKMYQQKFLQAVSLLSQNSVLVKRGETDNTEKVLDFHNSQMSDTDQTLSSIEELLRQVRQQATEEHNKGKQSKTDAEVPVSQMIATLKKIICSRYKKWHVRTDCDKAVFKRIKEFEDKVKMVLKKEEVHGLFDVKKYELEVMDVTIKESQENDSDELASPVSPVSPSDEAEFTRTAEDLRNWNNLNCISRRSSLAGSVDGSNSWIRLLDIFSHMKKIDHSETCRHFYAVLALLSHKNLSINYDTLFSKESAKLITKLLRTQSSNSTKYPVGAKIMTSRCPDIDRDEVLLAPVFNAESFRQILEADGYLSSSGYQSDSQASSSGGGSISGMSFTPTKSIAEAIKEFVLDPGEQFTQELFRRRRKN